MKEKILNAIALPSGSFVLGNVKKFRYFAFSNPEGPPIFLIKERQK